MKKSFYKIPLVLFTSLLSSCFPGEGFFEQTSSSSDTQEMGVSSVGEVSVASVFAGASLTQSISVPEGSPLSGTSLSIPPGALSVSMNITIQEAVTPASDSNLNSLGVTGADTSTMATVFANDQGVDAFSDGMAGTIQVSAGSGSMALALAELSRTGVMFSRHDTEDGGCMDTIYRIEDDDYLTTDTGKQMVRFKTPYFGTYQVLFLSTMEYTAEEKITDWGTTILAEHIPEECKVVTKQEKEVMDAKDPISLGMITSGFQDQTLTVTAPNISDTPKSCMLTVTDGETGVSLSKESTTASITVNLAGGGFPLYASSSFQCVFTDGRILEESVSFPIYGIRMDIDQSMRTVAVHSDLPDGGTCMLRAYHRDDPTVIHEESIASSQYKLLEFNDSSEDVDYFLRFSCTYGDTTLYTPYSHFDLGTCSTCSPGSPSDLTAPVITSINWATEASTPGSAVIEVIGSDEYGLSHLCFSMKNIGSTAGSFFHVGCFDLAEVATGTYEANVTLPNYYNPDTYNITSVEVADASGNRRWLRGDGPGSSQYRQGYELQDGSMVDEGLAAIAMFNWSLIAGTGNAPDNLPPTLSSLGTIPSALTLPSLLTLDFAVSDAGGSLTNAPAYSSLPVCFTFTNANGTNWDRCPPVQDRGAGEFRAELYLGTELENGEWHLKVIKVADFAGNQSIYHADPNTYAYMEDTAILVPNITLTGGWDNTPPQVFNVTWSAGLNPVFDVAGGSISQGLIIEATDAGGIDFICVWLDQFTYFYELSLGCFNPVNNGDGTYTVNLALPNYLQSSVDYVPSQIEVADTAGNITNLYNASTQNYWNNGIETPIIMPKFQFLNAIADTTAPTLNSISFSKTSLTAGNDLVVSLNYADDSGLDPGSFCISLQSASGNRSLYNCSFVTDTGGGNYTASVYFDDWVVNENYQAISLQVRDKAGNQSYITGTYGSANFDMLSIPIPSVTISGANPDLVGPVFGSTDPVFDMASYPAGGQGFLTLEITDEISGFNHIPYLNFDDFMGYSFPVWAYNVQSLGANLYKIQFGIDPGILPGTYTLSSIDLVDSAGNYSYYYLDSQTGTYTPTDPGWTGNPTITVTTGP